MKFSLLTLLILIVLCSGCVVKTDPIVSNETHIVIIGKLEYPSNRLNVSIMETSNTTSYKEKIITNADVKLYTRSSDGTAVLVTDQIKPNARAYENTEELSITVGDPYWITVTVPGKTGEYRSYEQPMLSPVPIKKVEWDADKYQVIFNDPEKEQNQYVAQFNFVDNRYQGSIQEIATDDDTLFNGNPDANLDVYFSNPVSYVDVSLSNVAPETRKFFKNFLEQKDQNEGFVEDGEVGDPGILFRAPPIQLQSNLYNTEDKNELVLGNFATMATSEISVRVSN